VSISSGPESGRTARAAPVAEGAPPPSQQPGGDWGASAGPAALQAPPAPAEERASRRTRLLVPTLVNAWSGGDASYVCAVRSPTPISQSVVPSAN
jgi:hypothetical protein